MKDKLTIKRNQLHQEIKIAEQELWKKIQLKPNLDPQSQQNLSYQEFSTVISRESAYLDIVELVAKIFLPKESPLGQLINQSTKFIRNIKN